MNAFEETTYIDFILEFEDKLHRELTIDEKEFLEWLAKKHAWELVSKRKSEGN